MTDDPSASSMPVAEALVLAQGCRLLCDPVFERAVDLPPHSATSASKKTSRVSAFGSPSRPGPSPRPNQKGSKATPEGKPNFSREAGSSITLSSPTNAARLSFFRACSLGPSLGTHQQGTSQVPRPKGRKHRGASTPAPGLGAAA